MKIRDITLSAVILLSLINAGPALSIDKPVRPTDPYIARGACPFECCTFREWTVARSVDLYANPNSSTRIARIDSHHTHHVRGLTGMVILHPVSHVLRHAIVVNPSVTRKGGRSDVTIPAAEEIWLLDRLGEGYVHLWWRGKVYDFGILDTDDDQDLAEGNTLLDKADEGAVWWVKVRTASGATGWTRDNDAFGDMDSCG